ncbi:proteophosphoglycan ppg4 [Rhodotorula toruloides]|uniref:Proteophosphoglycan ppg4 n=1 Tax=Rhodotorula toruloides TaxID=5286 RepID=A0A511KD01_RHOTO|nr:proteophosphoglycan ppg4 [Rhodotorula toruloides]
MPATLPLELVLDIVRVYIQRDFIDEDWEAYQARLAPLCLVCKVFKDVVQPVLWSHLRLSSSRQLKQLNAPPLFKHVEEFLGLGPVDRIGGQNDERPAQLVRWKMPSVGSVVLRGFARGRLSMEAWAPFAALRCLTLDNYILSNVPLTLRLPGLETLSLVRIRAWRESFRNLLHAQCTPSLRQLVLADLLDTEDANDFLPECYFPTAYDVDLRRLTAVQLEPQHGDMLPDSFVHPDGPFGEETAILLVWSAEKETFEPDEEKEFPQYLQLQIPSSVLEDESRHLAKMIYRISDMTIGDVLSAVFLPETVRTRRSVKPWIETAIKTLLDICIEFDVSVHYYSDWETTGMSKGFLRCLDDPDMEDENPLISENRGWSSIKDMPKNDDGTLWTLAEGLPDEEETSEYDEESDVRWTDREVYYNDRIYDEREYLYSWDSD